MTINIPPFPANSLEESNVVAFVKESLLGLQSQLESFNQETYKTLINFLIQEVSKKTYSDLTSATLSLAFAKSLAFYAQQFGCIKTCNNILEKLNEPQVKNTASSRLPFEYRYTKALSYFIRFNSHLRDNDKGIQMNKLDSSDLIESKYLLLKIYREHKSGKLLIKKDSILDTIQLLSSIFIQLGRWPEALNLLDTEYGVGYEPDDFMANYIRAKVLNDIMDQTCLDHNGLLLYRIHKNCNFVLNHNKGIVENIKNDAKKIRDRIQVLLNKYSLDVSDLEKHANKKHFSLNDLSPFTRFLYENKLFLNEHQFFCGCKYSLGDRLTIETTHSHTKIKWLENKKSIFLDIVAEFALARLEFFKSIEQQSLNGLHVNSFSQFKTSRTYLKMAMLKSSFRRCYSILDKICTSILESLEIDENTLVDEAGNRKKIYFLNVWDLEEITDADFKRNLSLHSLYSIAKDLDRGRKSALKNFKEVRNSIEHRFLQVVEGKGDLRNGKISEQELRVYSKILLDITRSAIFSYVYFLRRESIYRAKERCN